MTPGLIPDPGMEYLAAEIDELTRDQTQVLRSLTTAGSSARLSSSWRGSSSRKLSAQPLTQAPGCVGQ